MKSKKWISLCLAMIMMFNITPFGPFSTNAADPTITVKFPNSPSPKFENIIWGGTSTINVLYDKNYFNKSGTTEGLLISAEDGTSSAGQFAEALFKEITGGDQYTLTSKADVGTNVRGKPTAVFTISPSYDTLRKGAQSVKFTESADTANAELYSIGEFELVDQSSESYLLVSQDSYAKLTYKGASRFELTYDPSSTASKPAGNFTAWDNNQIVTAQGNPGDTADEYILRLTAYRNNRDFRFKPNAMHKDSTDPTVSVKTLKAGDVFEIKLEPVTPPPVSLTVYNQVDVLENVSQDATRPTNNFPTEFVTLGDTLDGFTYISSPYTLTTSYMKFGQKINLKWQWADTTEDWPDKNQRPTNLQDLSGLESTNAAGNSTLTVRPVRDINDKYGYLFVTTSYNDPNFFTVTDPADIVRVESWVPVKIPGTGNPPETVLNAHMTGKDSGPPSGYTSYPVPKEFPTKPLTMDVFQGGVAGYAPEGGWKPFANQFEIYPGDGNGFATQIVVDATNPNILDAFMGLASEENTYTFGQKFDNSANKGSPGNLYLNLVAKETGSTTLTFHFFQDRNGNVVEDPTQKKQVTITVVDSSPDPTARLSEMVISRSDTGNNLDGFTFSPETLAYDIEIPYSMANKSMDAGSVKKYLMLKPSRQRPAREVMGIDVKQLQPNGTWVDVTGDTWTPPANTWVPPDDWSETAIGTEPSLISGDRDKGYTKIMFTENDVGKTIRVRIFVRAQNPNIIETYEFRFTLKEPNGDATLKLFELYDEEETNFITSFKPEIFEYEVTVPYRTKWLKPVFETNFSDVAGVVFNPLLKSKQENFGKEEWWEFDRKIPGHESTGDYEITITPETERVEEIRTYKVHVIRGDPSHIATLESLQVTDPKGTAYEFTPVFDPEKGTYALDIPYSPGQVKIVAKTTDKYASMQVLEGDKVLIKDGDLKSEVPSDGISVPEPDPKNPLTSYVLTVLVTAEDEVTTRLYNLEIIRELPSTDGTLASVVVADQDKKEIPYDFYSNGDLLDYVIEVPYETEKVSFTPTATVESVQKITITDKSALIPVARPVQSGQTSRLYELAKPEGTTPSTTKFEIEITPEDPKASTVKYTYSIVRQAPSDDARLIKLEIANAENYKPVFAPDRLSYSATVTEGAEGVNITATANHPKATITIDGKKVESGVQSELIRILKEEQTVEIVVTAQDGKTKKIYKVKFTNPNLIQKSSNADLRDLEVNYGLMTPKFKPATEDYEVTVKEDVYDVDIIPKTDNKYATLEVFSGTKKIGDEDGNYSAAIQDGENEFTIKVTSQDTTKTKEYTIIVYRDEEDKQKTLKPTTVDDVDFDNTGDVIIIDISKYSRIESEVFKELKDNYPEKTLILEGNDYSLQFEGSELDKIIPSTEIYDFGMTFSSPFEDEIYDLIDEHSKNRNADVVLVHFKNDGTLPGPATLTLSLGREYKNEQLYWHYYNEERDRIDYYGEFKTNSKGTFTVPLTHMSTYIICDIRIYGSDDKSDLLSGLPGGLGGDLGQLAALKKVNPGTGTGGGEA